MTLMTQQREMGKVTATRRRETTVRMKEVRPEASSQSNIVNVRYRGQCQQCYHPPCLRGCWHESPGAGASSAENQSSPDLERDNSQSETAS